MAAKKMTTKKMTTKKPNPFAKGAKAAPIVKGKKK